MSKKIQKLTLSNDPHIHTRVVTFTDGKQEAKSKNKKQFETCNESTLTVILTDETTIEINAPKGYLFDGATIPFGIGKGNMKLQIPALFHDILCDNKAIVDFDRKLASNIFKECLLECGVNKVMTEIMYLAVEAFQSVFGNWEK